MNMYKYKYNSSLRDSCGPCPGNVNHSICLSAGIAVTKVHYEESSAYQAFLCNRVKWRAHCGRPGPLSVNKKQTNGSVNKKQTNGLRAARSGRESILNPANNPKKLLRFPLSFIRPTALRFSSTRHRMGESSHLASEGGEYFFLCAFGVRFSGSASRAFVLVSRSCGAPEAPSLRHAASVSGSARLMRALASRAWDRGSSTAQPSPDDHHSSGLGIASYGRRIKAPMIGRPEPKAPDGSHQRLSGGSIPLLHLGDPLVGNLREQRSARNNGFRGARRCEKSAHRLWPGLGSRFAAGLED